MECPTCGGTRRKQIAPNYWECRSPIQIPIPGPPSEGAFATQIIEEPCGHRYSSGAMIVGPQCLCMTYAIGQCTTCSKHVCGDHSVVAGSRRLCIACAASEQAQAAQEQQRRADQAAAEWQQRAERTRAAHDAAVARRCGRTPPEQVKERLDRISFSDPPFAAAMKSESGWLFIPWFGPPALLAWWIAGLDGRSADYDWGRFTVVLILSSVTWIGAAVVITMVSVRNRREEVKRLKWMLQCGRSECCSKS